MLYQTFTSDDEKKDEGFKAAKNRIIFLLSFGETSGFIQIP